MRVQLVQETARQTRTMRSPKHTFNLVTRPWQIQPFMIAPVLPGETLKSLTMQARVVTDPVKSKLVGWWHETYFFYVKHRDLTFRDQMIAMHLTGASLSATASAANDVAYYSAKGTQNYAQACLQRIVEEWFRSENETWNANVIDTLPVANIGDDTWLDSLVDDTVSPPAGNENQDFPDLTVMATYQAQYDRMRQMRFTSMTFEDWLESQGVKTNMDIAEDGWKPELVRYDREWVYPTNTVDPATGVPVSAIVASPAVRADKDRYFKEPGFLVGVCVSRPKVYLSKQVGAAVNALDQARLWLPELMSEEKYTSIKKHLTSTSADGPLGNNPTNAYWVDYRDLFIYGDQFVNFDISASSNANPVALPTAALQKRYASATDADALFVAGASNKIRQDGVVSLKILGRAGPDMT